MTHTAFNYCDETANPVWVAFFTEVRKLAALARQRSATGGAEEIRLEPMKPARKRKHTAHEVRKK